MAKRQKKRRKPTRMATMAAIMGMRPGEEVRLRRGR